MAIRVGRGRTPDPDRPGTVYRSGPLHPSSRSSPSSPAPDPLAEQARLGRDVRPRRRGRARWVVLLVVLALVGYPPALFGVAWRALDRTAALPDDGPADSPGRTYLVVGSDSREGLTAAERKALHTGSAAGRRTDTIMLLHVPSGGGPVALVSIPRDSYLPIPGRGKNKVNAAYAFGGPALLARTVEAATGVHVDEYVETGFGGFADMVDAVGGVELCPNKAIQDDKAHLDIAAGCQQVEGPTALAYARARYSDPRGDLGRVERQREVLAAIVSRTLSPAVLLAPWRSFPVASAGGHALTVDDGTTPVGLARFVLAMRSVSGGKGVSLTVPIGNPDLSTPAGSAVAWDADGAKAVFAAIRADDTEALRAVAAEQKK